MQLDGAIALVTGGASGLGLATARALTAAGAAVVIADLASSPGDAAAKEVGGVFVATDVTDPASVQAAVDRASAMGPLRVAVNCAGIGTPGRILGKAGPLPLEQFAKVVTVNLVGTFNVLRLAADTAGRHLPGALAQHRGDAAVLLEEVVAQARTARVASTATATTTTATTATAAPTS